MLRSVRLLPVSPPLKVDRTRDLRWHTDHRVREFLRRGAGKLSPISAPASPRMLWSRPAGGGVGYYARRSDAAWSTPAWAATRAVRAV